MDHCDRSRRGVKYELPLDMQDHHREGNQGYGRNYAAIDKTQQLETVEIHSHMSLIFR